ncbi:hypothetical protein IG631_05267 [Alternaria alternata]|nr:hypothetical protein IG631_05267 [Alternaria alternata]
MGLLPSLKGSAEKRVPKSVAQGSQILAAFSQMIPIRKSFFSLDPQQYWKRQRNGLYSTGERFKKDFSIGSRLHVVSFRHEDVFLAGLEVYRDLPDHAFHCEDTAVCSANTLIFWCCIIGKLKVCLGKMASAQKFCIQSNFLSGILRILQLHWFSPIGFSK